MGHTYEFEIKIGVYVNILHLTVLILVLHFSDLKPLNIFLCPYFCFHFSHIMKIKDVPEIILTPFYNLASFLVSNLEYWISLSVLNRMCMQHHPNY